MLRSVFIDLKFFLFFFAIFIMAFSLFLQILLPNSELRLDEQYQGILPLQYFTMALRTAIGDNDMDDYLIGYEDKKESHLTLVWIVWLLIILVGNIVFMNFIIAVVNESYENCMTKLVAQTYKVKIDMIVEREQMMTQADLNNQKWFPNYIIVRKLANNSDGGSGVQWQGFVKEIKTGYERAIGKLTTDISHKMEVKQQQSEKVTNALKQEI